MMSANSTGTETSLELLNDRLYLISGTTLLGVTYGVITCLYCMTTLSLTKKLFHRSTRSGSPSNSTLSKIDWRNTVFYLVYTSILFVLSTLYTAGNSHVATVAYIDNRLYPGGPTRYYETFLAGDKIMVMTDLAAVLILWMTDALILYRFIVIYHKLSFGRWIIPLPCAMYVGVIVLSTLVLHSEASLGKIFYLSEKFLLAYYALSFSLNILTTVLIAARLYWQKVQLDRVFGSATESPYMAIATMLIESAALYGAWSVVFLVLCIQQNPGQVVILATMSEIQVIAPLLITLWFARGKVWNRGKSYGESEVDGTLDGAVGLSINSRPSHLADEDDVRPTTGRDTSWSAVVRGSKVEHQGDRNVVELGLCGSKSSVLVDDLKVCQSG